MQELYEELYEESYERIYESEVLYKFNECYFER
jgi:hypothetical protein